MPSPAHELTANKYSAQRIACGSAAEDAENIPALDKPFLIPIYQRLYTWEEQHVDCLLTDLWEACQQQSAAEYFIGAVVVSPKPDDGSLELIDGQQRMTTLWLIASVLVTAPGLSDDSKEQWQAFMKAGAGPRLDFSGREQDKQALAGFMSRWQCGCGRAECNGWLKNEAMIVARRAITNFINKLAKQSQADQVAIAASGLQRFSDYLWAKATFVITTLHSATDKNRFFDSMNSRGVQLEKHEILKARLLNDMSEHERQVYAWAWDLCADINGYVKGSVQAELDYGRSAINIGTSLQSRVHAKALGEKGAGDDSMLTLEEILKAERTKTNAAGADDKAAVKHKSLVTFPVFLLHVLRVFLAEASPASAHDDVSVDHKKLIAEFDKHFPAGVEQKPLADKDQCKAFIHCLLRCRLLMDNFMIKGHVDEGSHAAVRWEIASPLAGDPSKKDRAKRTGKEWDSISMLQSMMYFSQDLTRAPWLTQTLKDLYKLGTEAEFDNAGTMLDALKQQDASYAQTVRKGQSLYVVLGLADPDADKSDVAKPDDTVLKVNGLGTDTAHYWFYKLEYLLWEKWFNSEDARDKASKPALLNSKGTYRMRHVTSVEHVSPQSTNNGTITPELLDRFGNLALLSIGENSSYSDRAPIEKKGAFEASLERGIIQSLKLAHIFSAGREWSDTAMDAHEAAMMDILLAAHPQQPQGATV